MTVGQSVHTQAASVSSLRKISVYCAKHLLVRAFLNEAVSEGERIILRELISDEIENSPGKKYNLWVLYNLVNEGITFDVC